MDSIPCNIEGWATRSYNMTRVPVEKATVTAVVTPHILYFRNQPSTKHSELCLLYPLSHGNFCSIPVPRARPRDRLTESVCIKVNFNYLYLGHPRIAPLRAVRRVLGKGTLNNEISVSDKVETHSGGLPKEALKEKKQEIEVRLERHCASLSALFPQIRNNYLV